MEIMKVTIKEDFHRGTVFLVVLSQNHIIEKKYDIKLITLISMYVPFKTSCELGQVH